jgi:hypothetical protein
LEHKNQTKSLKKIYPISGKKLEQSHWHGITINVGTFSNLIESIKETKARAHVLCI